MQCIVLEVNRHTHACVTSFMDYRLPRIPGKHDGAPRQHLGPYDATALEVAVVRVTIVFGIEILGLIKSFINSISKNPELCRNLTEILTELLEITRKLQKEPEILVKTRSNSIKFSQNM